jgi:hypothetical protein
MQRAMARQAEAERNRRPNHQRRRRVPGRREVYDASEIISRSPSALQLRYLQTLADLGVNQNTTVVFPLPIEILRGLDSGSSADGARDRAARPGRQEAA